MNRDAVSVRIRDEGKVTDRTFNMVDDKGDASLFQLRNSFIQIRHLEGDRDAVERGALERQLQRDERDRGDATAQSRDPALSSSRAPLGPQSA